MAQARRETEGLGTSAKSVDADLARVAAQLKAMGDAAAMATQQFQRVQLENAGLATTADSAGQMLRKQQDETMKVGAASQAAGRQIGFLESAVRGVIAGIGVAGLVQLGQTVFTVGTEFDDLRGKITSATGSAAAGAAGFTFVRLEADRLALQIQDTAANYADFVAGTASSGLSRTRRDDIFSALNEAGAAYNLTQQQINQNFDQVIRIGGKAKITLDDLAGTLGTNLPQTFDAVARGLGITNDQLRNLIKNGELAGNEVLPALGDGLRLALGTSAQTEIAGAANEVKRLRNELLLLADNTSGPVKSAFGDLSSYIATLLRYERENGLTASVQTFFAPLVDTAIAGANAITGGNLRGIGSLARSTNAARDFVTANPFAPQLFDPNRPAAAPFISPGRPAPDFLTGANLLSFGQSAPDPRAQRDAQRDANRALRDDAREAARAAADELRDRQRALEIAVEREASERRTIEDTRVRAAIVAEELRTGEALTGAARDLFELKARGRSTDQASLATELEKLAALEAQVKAQKDSEELARNAQRARDRADAASQRFLRRRDQGPNLARGEEDSDPFGRLDSGQERARGLARQEYQSLLRLELDAQIASRAAGTEDFAANLQRQRDLAAAHAEALMEIDQGYANARVQVFAEISMGTAAVFGQLATLAQSFGRKGFETYKAFAIAQALVAIPGVAIEAYKSTVGIPVVGPFLAPVAAATAVAIQLRQVAQIRAAQPPGRRFGGSVAAGGLYEVTESGVPEVFRDSRTSRSYLLPGNAGEVVPLGSGGGNGGAAGGGALNLNVQVINQVANAQVRTERSTDADGRPTLRLIVAEIGRDIREGGEVGSAIRDTYGLRRAGRVL
ncbi:tape measure protein [Nevskia sp.]|uniref:tape measure protein n=1 Tax=Nevskia sp. TaxID=1929292 RepID=UPI0025D1B0DC|nr:tape measure protein [Nevskia sp.]